MRYAPQILAALQSADLTTREIAERIGAKPDVLKHHMRRLRADGKLRVVGEFKIANGEPNTYTVKRSTAPRSAAQIMGEWRTPTNQGNQ